MDDQIGEEKNTFNPKIILGVLVVVIVVLVAYFIFSGGALTEEEKNIVLTPPQTGEEEAYNNLVKKHAVSSPVLTIGPNCEMDPLIIEITTEQELTIKNTDSIIHIVSFEDQNAFSVSPGRERTINIKQTFSRNADAYRYRCNNISMEENVGVMYVVE